MIGSPARLPGAAARLVQTPELTFTRIVSPVRKNVDVGLDREDAALLAPLKFGRNSPKFQPVEIARATKMTSTEEPFGSGGPSMERAISTSFPQVGPEGPDVFLDRLLHPARHFERPQDVLIDETLDVQEKRAILSSWASDACAVESMPALRMPPGVTEPVGFDAIMDALRQLDQCETLPASRSHDLDIAAAGFTALVDRL